MCKALIKINREVFYGYWMYIQHNRVSTEKLFFHNCVCT